VVAIFPDEISVSRMQTLPVLPMPAAILSFDFDGTLHDPASDPAVPAEFFELIRELRVRHRVLWGINTGRSLGHLQEGFVESRFPFLPDWVVAREREIYLADRSGGWLPHAPWNRLCDQEVHGLFQRAARLMAHIRREVEEHTGAQWMEWQGEPAGVIARTEEEMAWIVNHVTPFAAEEPHLSWQRNSIWLRFGHRDFHKGSSLSEVARIHRLPTQYCFAMGDSHNDMDMLDPAHAGMTACPANAVEEIQAKVRSSGGLVTTTVHGQGVIEALRHYFRRETE
jgi:hypothetical protein